MRNMSGREFFLQLGYIKIAEQYLIERTHKELVAHNNAAPSGINGSTLAFTAYAVIFMSAMVILVGDGSVA